MKRRDLPIRDAPQEYRGMEKRASFAVALFVGVAQAATAQGTDCGDSSTSVSVGGGSMVAGAGATPGQAQTQAKVNLLPVILHCNKVCPNPEATCDEDAGWRGGASPNVTPAAWNPQLGHWSAQASIPSGSSMIGWITCSNCYVVDPDEL